MNVSEPGIVRLDLPASYQYLHLPGACTKALLEEFEPREKFAVTAYNIELAVYETCTNIVEHAYAQKTGRIKLSFSLSQNPDKLVIIISDTGDQFDISAEHPLTVEPGQERGYGLFLVYQLMDEVSYMPEPGKNTWQLTKLL